MLHIFQKVKATCHASIGLCNFFLNNFIWATCNSNFWFYQYLRVICDAISLPKNTYYIDFNWATCSSNFRLHQYLSHLRCHISQKYILYSHNSSVVGLSQGKGLRQAHAIISNSKIAPSNPLSIKELSITL